MFDILSRIDLRAGQVKTIISDDRENVSITASIAEMAENPYIIFEQYIGYDSDDTIPFYKIDNGVIPLLEYGIDEILDNGSTERFRAFCVDELNRIAAHSFGNGDIDKDLGVYFWNEQEELETLLANVMIRDMQKYTGMTPDPDNIDQLWFQMIRDSECKSNPEVIQVISPYRGEFYGTGSINALMQKVFNSKWSKKQLDGIRYFDKVIQFRNRPQSDPAYAYQDSSRKNIKSEIFNGEMGLTRIHGLDSYAPKGQQAKYKWQGNIDRL